MKKGFTVLETLISLAVIAILTSIMFTAGSAATDKALEMRVQHSTLLQLAREEAYKLISSNETEEQSYTIQDKYIVNVESCGNGFTLELYDKDLEFEENIDGCEQEIEIASFDACNTMKPVIKKVCLS